jgi:hypothetical protein
MIFSDFTVKEELLKVLHMKRQTKGYPFYNRLKTLPMEIS